MKTGLVISEDVEFRRAVASWLKERHWTVLEARDREAGLKLSQKHPPQLVLCDLLRPRDHGFQFCREMLQLQDPANPCLMIATGDSGAPDHFQSLEAGADEYLAQPLDFEKLSAILARRSGPPPAAAASGPAPGGTRLKFWGVRGSIPAPGAETAYYGGNTSCVELRVGNDIIILDSGTGIRPLGRALVAEFKDRPIHLNLLITHTHWDHIQGFPFFMPAYDPRNRITVVGFEGARQGLQSTLSSQMESPYFPITMHQMPGHVLIEEFQGLDFQAGAVPVRAQFLNHPGACTGYRLATPGGDISYLPDVELCQRLRANPDAAQSRLDTETPQIAGEHDRKIIEFIRDSEVLILDAQFTAGEYQEHVGWGHSCAEDTVAFALRAKVKRLFLFHHDPEHSDEQISRMVARGRQIAARHNSPLRVEAAREGLELVLDAAAKRL
ncbi:MAG: MBL fold metallo-hydrolase [Verrucomicrobiota bacterium]|jgi:phosphoribosyl 1,2-cyclic phosphodiesterase